MQSFLHHWTYLALLILTVAEAACIPIPSEVTVGYAGYLASTGHVNLVLVIVLATVGETVGAFIAYGVGRTGGRAFVDRFGRYVLLSHADLDRAQHWFEKRGEWSVAIGRIVPLVRTFIAFPAGVAEMPRSASVSSPPAAPWSGSGPWPGPATLSVIVGTSSPTGSPWPAISWPPWWSWPSPPSSITAGTSSGPSGAGGTWPPPAAVSPAEPVSSGKQRLVWQRGLLFEGEDSRSFPVPISGDPDIEGAKPSDLFPLSLASCLAYDVVVVLGKKRQELRHLVVDLISEQEDVPPFRFVRITLRFEVSGVIEMTAADRALELAVKNCPVLASVSPAVDIVTAISVVPT